MKTRRAPRFGGRAFRTVGAVLAAGTLVGLPSPGAGASPGTGPGGVDAPTGNGDLRLWLQGDRDVTTVGGAVTGWGDTSGYGNHATVAEGTPTASTDPTFNGLGAVSFPNTGTHYLTIPDAASLDITTGFSVFTLVRRTDGGTNCGVFSKRAGCGGTCNYGYFLKEGDGHPQFEFANNGFQTSSHIYITFQNSKAIVGTTFNESTLGVVHYKAGRPTNTGTMAAGMLTDTNALEIGRNGGCGGENMRGDIAELIVYARQVNAAEAALIQNYLASKYNGVIDTEDGGIELYTGDTSAKGDYDRHVAGIARINGAVNQLGNSGGLVISNSGYLANNGDSVVAGHNGMGVTPTTDDVPAGVTRRWSRVWYLDRTSGGAHGAESSSIDLAFDFSDAGLNVTPSGTYKLLRRAGTSGPFADTGATATINGDQVTFSGLDVSSIPAGYFTLATDGGVLPVSVSGYSLE